MKPREVIRKPLADIDPDPEQVRREFPEEPLRELAQSLLGGQIHPLLVYLCTKTGRLTILDGERRYRAASLAGLDSLEVLVVDEPSGSGSRLQKQLAAAIHNEALSPAGRAQGIRRVMAETGWNAKQVAEALGISPATVSRDLKIAALDPAILDRVASGDISPAAAYQIAKAQEPEVRAELADRAARGELTRDAAAREVRRSKTRAPDAAAPGARRATAMLAGGRQVSFAAADPLTITDVIEMAEDVLAKAKKYRNRGVELATFLAQLKLDAKVHAAKPGDDSAEVRS